MRNTLKQNIERQLNSTGLSIKELERQSGLKPSTIQNILNGRSKNPTIETLLSISKRLNCTVDELLNNTSTEKLSLTISHGKNKTTEWIPDLYKSCIDAFEKATSNKNLTICKETAISCINEIYSFSINNENHNINHRFIEWLLERIPQE